MEGIRSGWIELDGMYGGLLTGLANEEVLRWIQGAFDKIPFFKITDITRLGQGNADVTVTPVKFFNSSVGQDRPDGRV